MYFPATGLSISSIIQAGSTSASTCGAFPFLVKHINVVEQSVIVTEADSRSVETQPTTTHMFNADCTQTIIFISCVCAQMHLMSIVKVK